MSVSVQLIQAMPTATRWYASSARSEWAKASTPALEAQYALIIGAAPIDANEAI